MRSIFLFTHSYPYGTQFETFLYSEIEIASKKMIDLTIIPLKRENSRRDLPLNIKFDARLAETSFARRFVVFLDMMFSYLFWKIPFQDKYPPKSMKQLIFAIKYLYGSFLIKNFILSKKIVKTENTIVYSYWFNHTILGAVLAKLHNPLASNFKIITRAHAFDVYESKQGGRYFPYRYLGLKYVDQVYTVANDGKIYLSRKYSDFYNKFSVARLGTLPIAHHKIVNHKDKLSFLSCSAVIPAKRVDLIFNSILNYAKNNPLDLINWTHIGSGTGFNRLGNLVISNTLSNLKIELKGLVENNIVREILSKERFDIFINLSTTEGVPVSIMEAISVGIPILATNVGGNNEIVTSETGVILPVDFVQDDFNSAVDKIITSGVSLRETTYNFYKTNFDAEINYSKFYDALLN